MNEEDYKKEINYINKFFSNENISYCTLELLKIMKNFGFNIYKNNEKNNQNSKLLKLNYNVIDLDPTLYLNLSINNLIIFLNEKSFKVTVKILNQEYDITSLVKNKYLESINKEIQDLHQINDKNSVLFTYNLLKSQYDYYLNKLKYFLPIKDCLLSSNDITLCLKTSSSSLTSSSNTSPKEELQLLIQTFHQDLFNKTFDVPVTINHLFNQINMDVPLPIITQIEFYDRNNFNVLTFQDDIVI